MWRVWIVNWKGCGYSGFLLYNFFLVVIELTWRHWITVISRIWLSSATFYHFHRPWLSSQCNTVTLIGHTRVKNAILTHTDLAWVNGTALICVVFHWPIGSSCCFTWLSVAGYYECGGLRFNFMMDDNLVEQTLEMHTEFLWVTLARIKHRGDCVARWKKEG